MKAKIFAKRIKTHDGKSFTIFVTNLERKDGSRQYMRVMYSGKARNKAFDTDLCPLVIEFNREDANVSTETYTDKSGEERKSYTLWL